MLEGERWQEWKVTAAEPWVTKSLILAVWEGASGEDAEEWLASLRSEERLLRLEGGREGWAWSGLRSGVNADSEGLHKSRFQSQGKKDWRARSRRPPGCDLCV